MKKFSALMFVLALISVSFGQSTKKTEIKKINSYVKTVSTYVDKNPKKLEIYADISETNKPKWRKFNSKKALEKFRENNDVYNSAYVWRKNNKVIAVNLTFSSESGDWVHYNNHYFRLDGSLTKIDADLNTFYGHLIALRTLYFDKNGKLLRKDKQFYSMNTKKPIKPNEEFIDEPVYIYKKVSQLPFFSLLKN